MVPPDLVDAFVAARAAIDRQTSTLMQAVVADFINEGHFLRHIRRMRTLYSERQETLLRAAQRDLGGALDLLESRGWKREHTFEIPHGPCCSFRSPGGHRIALYQLTRPEVAQHFEGRRDF